MERNAEKRKHGEILPSTIRAIICGPSNCGNQRSHKFVREFKRHTFENVYVYLKSLQQPKYRYLKNLFKSIDEISYFTFSNNSDVVPLSELKFYFYL